MKRQAGFSLVELVIVIIVVGLLAVAALPRFINITDEAKKASIEGVAGGYATAVLSARAQWEAYGRPNDGSRNIVDYDGTEFYLTTDGDTGNPSLGYPIALSSKGISSINSTDCVALIDNLLQNPPRTTTSTNTAKDGKHLFYTKTSGSGNNKVCEYYQLASSDSSGNTSSDVTNAHYFTYKLAKGQVEVTLK